MTRRQVYKEFPKAMIHRNHFGHARNNDAYILDYCANGFEVYAYFTTVQAAYNHLVELHKTTKGNKLLFKSEKPKRASLNYGIDFGLACDNPCLEIPMPMLRIARVSAMPFTPPTAARTIQEGVEETGIW